MKKDLCAVIVLLTVFFFSILNEYLNVKSTMKYSDVKAIHDYLSASEVYGKCIKTNKDNCIKEKKYYKIKQERMDKVLGILIN